ERGRDGGVGHVVGWYEDGLNRRDGALPRGGDALLERAHLGRQGGLVADRRRHPAQQGRDLGAGQHVPEDVVDEHEDVRAFTVAEVLGHGQAGQAHAGPGAGRLVHLPEYQRGLVEHTRIAHLAVHVVAFARALTNTRKDGPPLVLMGDVADQLLDDDRLAHPGPTEETDLGTLYEGADE